MSRLATRARSRLAHWVALVVVGALALTGCDFSVYSLPLPGGADLGDDPYSVTVEFRDVLDLVPQSAVKVDDVTVGRVDDIEVDGYHAEVTLLVRRSVKLPGNAEATIRQTSLLGEKFVSLAPPTSAASSERLGDGDVIPLSRSGRNPEVEEVLGALSLLLNGGGVAQLKTIANELNTALDGREGDARSVLRQIDRFMGQIDTNKDQIVRAIESLNRLAVSLNKQKSTLDLALDELPEAVASVDRQRDDLVKMLRALTRLSTVGTRVIQASKAGTIDSLNALAPTLTKLAEAGDSLPKALQVFLTYPFVDSVVGKNPAEARNLHMGDYTNLDIQLDLDLTKLPTIPGPPLPEDVCRLDPTDSLCQPDQVLTALQKCLRSGDLTSKACQDIGVRRLVKACKQPANRDNPVCRTLNRLPLGGERGPLGTVLDDLVRSGGGSGGGSGSDSGGGAGGSGCNLPLVCRAAPGDADSDQGGTRSGAGAAGARPAHDDDLGALLVWGMVQR
jgi:phospholipid/cholesterol/gamma-HCH transport system substrate-binding protein